MEKYQEGLNYVPLLSQNPTPPCSGRSRMSLNMRRSHHSFIFYNGNYEGDISMLTDKGFELERLNLVDTESDGELQRDVSPVSATKVKDNYEKTSLVWRLMKFLIIKYVNPEVREQISIYMEYFTNSAFYNKILKWRKFARISYIYFFYLTTILCKYLSFVCNFFWRRRLIFNNLARRLLWRLTLAKCSDLSLFLFILLSIPALFILSLIGFSISLCGYLKDAFYHWGQIANKI